jgi:PIN domain nuclease of toxin-antitoxin system
VIAAIADTHTVIWYLFADSRLSARAKEFIEKCASQGHHVGVSAITLAEVVYLSEKARIAPATFERILATLQDPLKVFVEVPLTSLVVSHMQSIPREQVPDLPDRVIAATALQNGVPVISRDNRIQAAQLQTIW